MAHGTLRTAGPHASGRGPAGRELMLRPPAQPLPHPGGRQADACDLPGDAARISLPPQGGNARVSAQGSAVKTDGPCLPDRTAFGL